METTEQKQQQEQVEQQQDTTTSTETTQQKEEDKQPYFDLGVINQPIEHVPVPVKHVSETAFAH